MEWSQEADDNQYMTIEGTPSPDEVGQQIIRMREKLLAKMTPEEREACNKSIPDMGGSTIEEMSLFLMNLNQNKQN
jgi:hypothetical protein